MTTPIVMLVLMTGPYALLRLWSAVIEVDLRAPAAFGLALLFAFMGSGHFFQVIPMSQM